MVSSPLSISLPAGKKAYFASDFHLGVPDWQSSRQREKKIVRWLNQIQEDAHIIFLVGDVFDFWFEYKHAVPKGFIRLQGKLAELTDNGISVVLFTGNHDMWLFDYFTKELTIPVYRQPQPFIINNQKLLVGHGDGLGPGDRSYKILKKIFANKLAQWLFARLHPNFGIGLANRWSQRSRIVSQHKDNAFLGDDEWILTYCREIEQRTHHDYYIFGHRHLPLDLPINGNSRYLNLGEWVHYCTYVRFDGFRAELLSFEASTVTANGGTQQYF